jgi:hypothetical protein
MVIHENRHSLSPIRVVGSMHKPTYVGVSTIIAGVIVVTISTQNKRMDWTVGLFIQGQKLQTRSREFLE